MWGRRVLPTVLAGLCGVVGCADSTTTSAGNDGPDFPPAADDTLPYVYVVPETTGDGWETASLAEVGLDEARLTLLVDLIRAGTYAGVHGLVIVKDGKLVMEEYFNGFSFEGAQGDSVLGRWTAFDRDEPHNLASVTKSITSLLVGIAIDEGLIASVDAPLYGFFPEHADTRSPRKDSISLAHVLTMTSGLEWDESTYPYGDARNDINALFSEPDPVRYVLAKAAVEPPGTAWLYNGGGTNVLGDVVRSVTGEPLGRFADEHLFGPLGIPEPEWVMLQNGVTYASGDLRMRPRDMAKIGWLLADEGRWKGTQVVSADWVARSSAWYAETRNPGWGYGFQWWLHDFQVEGVTYASVGARGWGGQLITVFPDEDLVVVQTAGNYLTSDNGDAVVSQFVLRAVAR